MPPRCRTAEKMLDPSEKVWSTLRCLEYQLEAHEARFHRDGDVNWQAIRHMIMAAQHEARTTGAALRRAWTDEDVVGDDLAQTKLKLRETEQELQRLRRVHMEFQSEELTEARVTIADLRQQLANAQRCVSDAFAEVNSVRQQLDAANAALVLQLAGIERLQACLTAIKTHVDHMHDVEDLMLPLVLIRDALEALNASTTEPCTESNSSVTLTSSPPTSVTQILDDSSGADGPGQS